MGTRNLVFRQDDQLGLRCVVIELNGCLERLSRSLMSDVIAGWDILLLSRHPLPDASLTEIQSALIQLLSRAGLLNETNES
jgi:hypothetical protein